MNIDIASLRTFIEVMDLGSFAAVARSRDLDPSSISRIISGLEAETGTRLFQRTTRRLSPTEAGMVLYERIQPLVSELEDSFEFAKDISSDPKGTLRITASISFGQKILAPSLKAFKQQYPLLKVELELTDRNLDLISERIDIAIRHSPPTDTMLVGTKLWDTSYRVCASEDYIREFGKVEKPEDLSSIDCLRMPLTGHRNLWKFRDRTGKTIEVPVDGSLVISNPIALLSATLAGCGPALLADRIVDDEIEKGNLVDLFSDYDVTATDFDTGVWLLYTSRDYLPSKTRAFIDFMKKEKW